MYVNCTKKYVYKKKRNPIHVTLTDVLTGVKLGFSTWVHLTDLIFVNH